MSDESANVTTLPTKRRLPDDRPSHRPSTRVKRALERQQIINLLLGGATEVEIAKALDIKAQRVTNLIGRILDSWEKAEQADVEKVRALQLARLDRLVRAHWPASVGIGANGAQVAPSRQSAEFILKAEMLRADIAGTKAAKRIEVAGSVGFHLEPEDIARADQAWLASGGDAIEGTATDLDAIADASSG